MTAPEYPLQPLERRTLKRDRQELVTQAKCPGCGCWGDCDGDHLAGRISILCPECGWHGWIDGRKA
jgi:hypothetical protein